jgi:uncharacterized protein (DUF1800 family)
MATGDRLLDQWKPRAGDWNRAAATHLLERAGFGPEPEEADRLASGSVADAIASIFAPVGHNNEYLRGIEIMLGAGNIEFLSAWWIGLIVRGGDNLRERIALMWHDHFATSNAKVKDVRLMHGQNKLFREHGMGDFRQLLHKVAKDPCMLIWLDGDSNRAGAPNENFGREVMELFTLGIGNYTESDIEEAARCLSGWGTKGRAFRYRAKYHDDGVKTLLGQTGNFTPEQALDIMLVNAAAPRHIARRLLAEFITTDASPELVGSAARLLVDCDWNIEQTVRVLLTSEAFFDTQSRRARIASPVELVARATRILGSNVPPKILAEAIGEMGQSLFAPPSVKGWDGERVWINAGTWTARHNSMAQLLESEEYTDIAVALNSALEANSMRDAARETVRILLPGLADDPAGTAFTEAVADAAHKAATVQEATRIASVLVLTSPEYQLI